MAGVTTTLAIAAAASAASGAVAANASKKAARQGLNAAGEANASRNAALDYVLGRGLFDAPDEVYYESITPEQVGDLAENALAITERAAPRLNDLASASNKQATADLESSLDQLLGGRFGELRDETVGVVMDQLQGRLSEGTRSMLAREATGRGIAQFGRGAVDRAYTGFLGLTAEGQAQQGVGNAQNLTSLFGQLAPRESGINLMRAGFGGLTTSTALQIEQSNRQGQFQAAQFNASGDFTARTNQANALLNNASQNAAGLQAAKTQAAQLQAQATGQMAQGISTAVSGFAGGLSGYYQQQAALKAGSTLQAAAVPVADRANVSVPFYQGGNLTVGSASDVLAAAGLSRDVAPLAQSVNLSDYIQRAQKAPNTGL